MKAASDEQAPMRETDVPTFKPALKALILEMLRVAYKSTGKDEIVTGNHYQSVKLGSESTRGFRADRDRFLDQIDFQATRVLDLGSNLGEITRSVRERGALTADGYEYDPFFIEIAELVNAYNNTTGVSFYQRDITDPAVFIEHYDIVLALSVFTYIHPVLDQISKITDRALVVETHKLNGNLESGYIDPIRRYFPVYEVLGESDWGRELPETERRALVVFARTHADLDRVLGRHPAIRPRSLSLDAQRTALQGRFFRDWNSTGDALLAEIDAREFVLEALANRDDLATNVYSGRDYWIVFLKGYCQYMKTRNLGPGNIYYDYIVDYYAPRGHDPGVASALRDPLFALHRIASRFQDLDRYRRAPTKHIPAPVRLFQSPDSAGNHLIVYETGRDQPVRAARVDGWHRLFAARIFGARDVPAEVVEASLPGR